MAQNEKLKTCKHCGAQMPAKAAVCPQCGGKNGKPIYKRWWLWLLVAVLILSAVGESNANAQEDAPAADSSAVEVVTLPGEESSSPAA